MSLPFRPIAALLLGLALAASAYAEPPTQTETIPTWEQLKEWKTRIIAPYREVSYLDLNGAAMSEAAFMRALHDDHPSIKMDFTDVDGRKEKIVLRIVPHEATDKPAVK